MKVFNLDSFYFISKVEKHNEMKQKMMDMIKITSSDSTTNSDTNYITRTDYHLDNTNERIYLPLFFEMVDPLMKNLADYMLAKELTVHHAWFQEYWQFDKHDWHTHGAAQFANIYYLDLPDKRNKTEFFNILDKKIISDIEVEEGDLITFPAYIIHRSNTNSENKKTIISFNSSFETIDEKKVDKLL
tara:strand:+ start:174 stop:734 length:561 start_codon:yes stop_codon:yes gene_type:complete